MIPKRKFSDLLTAVGTIPGLERLRFVTSHPRYMSLGVVEAVAEIPAACECFHIPFQSGSTEVLAKMGRGHTREKYLHIVDRIRTVREPKLSSSLKLPWKITLTFALACPHFREFPMLP